MRKILLVIFFFLIAVQTKGDDRTWKVANKANFTSISGSYFYNQNIGWVVGASRTFAKTIDGGLTWTKFEDIPSNSSSFYCVQFLTKTMGFVGVSNNELIKTTDDGVTWTSIDVGGPDGGAVRSVYFVDENTGWVLVSKSSEAQIRYTSDGGTTWTTQMTNSTGDIEAMAFRSATSGVCVGGGSGRMDIYYTHDGQNWARANIQGVPSVYTRLDLRAVVMNENNEAFAVGWGSQAAGLQPSLILKSSNGGEDWQYMEQAVEDRQYVNLNAVNVIDDTTLIAGGGAAYEGTVMLKSTDDGITWHRLEAKYGIQIKTISVKGSKLLASGSGGGIIYSDDGGATWTMPDGIIPTTSLYAIFKTGDTIFAGGYDGLLVKSTDNGLTWKAVFASDGMHCPTIKDISFVNENVGYVARYNRMVSKTVDGGETWTTVMQDTNVTAHTLYGVQFLDENTGFVVGKSGTGVSAFYKTTDGGNSWSKQIGVFSDHLLGVHFTDAQHGVVCGRDLTLYYTTDGGASWTAGTINGSPDPSADLDKVVFYDSQNGIAFGDVILKTSDGGVTWDYIAPPSNSEMKSGVMLSPEHWILTGGSEINETTDGGISWANIIDWNVFDNLQLYGIATDSDNYLWVSSSSSEVYTTSPLVSVSDETIETPNRFVLNQNYPNPVVKGAGESGATNISFKIPSELSGRRFELSVYNVLGQKIKTLFNQVKTQGSYNFKFNISDLPAGLYFYRLNSGGFSVVKKMVIVK